MARADTTPGLVRRASCLVVPEPRQFTRARAGAWLRGTPGRGVLAGFALLGAAASGVLASPWIAVAVSVAVPSALMLTRRPLRGHRALTRALASYRRERDAAPGGEGLDHDRGEQALRELVDARVSMAVRLEAAGRLAVAALDRGEIAAAVAVLEAADAGRERARPARALGLGLIGELMRNILARLGVSRFEGTAESVVLAPGNPQAPATERDRDDYVAVLSMLELLEAEAGGAEPILEAAWRRTRASGLDQRFGGLALIADAAAGRRLPAARSAVERVFEDRERAAAARPLLAGLFPGLVSELGEHGYRRPGPVARTLATMDSNEPPAEITALVEAHDRGMLAQRFGVLSCVMAGPVGVVSMALPGVGAVAVLVATGLVATRIERALRAGPVAAMPYGPRGAWLREIVDAPDAPAPLGDRSAPLRAEALALYLCCVRAEQSLARGETEAAWSWVEWWFADRDNRRAPKLSLHPVASTLLRVARLSNRTIEARSLAGVLEPGAAQRLRVARRTVHGDAPRALALAKALVYARACAWSEAARALERVSGEPGVIMSERDEVLYALVAQRISRMIPTVDPRLCAVSPRSVDRVRAFLVVVWPQLIQRTHSRR